MKKIIILLILLLAGKLVIYSQDQVLKSGLAVGEDCPAFDPKHVSGPDKGTKACPMCKYGYQQGIMIWMNTDDWNNMALLTSALEKEISKRGLKKLRVFLMYMNPEGKSKEDMEKMLTDFSAKNDLKKVAITYIPSPTDDETAGSYEINPDKKVKNTIFVFKKRGVVDKKINFVSTESSIRELLNSVEKAV